MFAKINGTEIFFDIDGAGYMPKKGKLTKRPVCFVLHGGPGESHGYFKPFLNPLTENMQLIYVDHRGCGYSKKDKQSAYSLENNVEDLEALRQYLGLDKVWILGHSYGGMVAQAYALKYQENLAGLVLATTAPSYRFLEKSKDYIDQHGTEKQKELAQVLYDGAFTSNEHVARYYEATASLYTNEAGKNKTDLSKFDILTTLDRCYQALNEGFGGFLRTFDFTDRLQEITVPTIVIAGKYDWITPVEENKIIADGITGSKFVLMENSSHNVMEEEMEKFNKEIISFITENS